MTPQAGDIWQWRTTTSNHIVILVEQVDEQRWRGYDVEDQEIEYWWFEQHNMHNWRKLA